MKPNLPSEVTHSFRSLLVRFVRQVRHKYLCHYAKSSPIRLFFLSLLCLVTLGVLFFDWMPSPLISVRNGLWFAPKEIASTPKLVLYWTKFFEREDFYVGLGDKPFKNCPLVTNCLSTKDRSLLYQSDAVIFHIGDIRLHDLPLFRLPHQRWIFFYVEPPHHTVPLSPYANFFNWTMTYRSDSDIYHPYGRTWPITRRVPSKYVTHKARQWVTDLKKFRELRNSPLDDEVDLQFDYDSLIRNKTKSVAWFVSNCNSKSGREHFARQLSQFIDVDIYGKCGNLTCKGREVCLQMVGRDYRFYLALENSVCKDYVTEKFFNMLEIGVVPIVFGLGAHEKIAPPQSYINADAFESPQALANYLHLLIKNDTLYKEYLLWNNQYKPKNVGGWCTLCEMLNNPNLGNFVYRDIQQWWINQANCELRV